MDSQSRQTNRGGLVVTRRADVYRDVHFKLDKQTAPFEGACLLYRVYFFHLIDKPSYISCCLILFLHLLLTLLLDAKSNPSSIDILDHKFFVIIVGMMEGTNDCHTCINEFLFKLFLLFRNKIGIISIAV